MLERDGLLGHGDDALGRRDVLGAALDPALLRAAEPEAERRPGDGERDGHGDERAESRREAAEQPLQLRADDVAAGMVGAVVKDPVADTAAWTEYLEAVARQRPGWGDFYAACREVSG